MLIRQPVNVKPNKWLAAALGLIFHWLGLLYVGQPLWALAYFAAEMGLAFAGLVQLIPMWLLSVPVLGIAVACAVQAYFVAVRYPAARPRPHYSRWYGLLGMAVAYVLLVFLFRAFLYEPFRAASGAMLPTFRPGTKLLVQKWGYGHYSTYGIDLFRSSPTVTLHRGELIVFDFPLKPETVYMKRLIGLPGDHVSYRDKQLFINGMAVMRQKVGAYRYERPGKDVEEYTRYAETLDGTSYDILIRQDRPPYAAEAVRFNKGVRCQYDDHGVSCDVPQGAFFVLGDNRDNSSDSRYWGFVPADHIVGMVVHVPGTFD